MNGPDLDQVLEMATPLRERATMVLVDCRCVVLTVVLVTTAEAVTIALRASDALMTQGARA